MASAFTLSQSDLHDSLQDTDREPRNASSYHTQSLNHQFSTADDISPALSRVNSESLSPSIVHLDTPDVSHSTPGHYQPSDYSDLDPDEDPFFGVDFTNPHAGGPSFLAEAGIWEQSVLPTEPAAEQAQSDDSYAVSYPLTPDQSSLHLASPAANGAVNPPASVSPRDLQRTFKGARLAAESSQLTPAPTGSGRSSEDGLVPAPVPMPVQSPRVTVSNWDNDNGTAPALGLERTFDDNSTVRGVHSVGELISTSRPGTPNTARRDSLGRWEPDTRTGHSGIEPRNRSSDEVPSINELAAQNARQERNQEVGRWLQDDLHDVTAPTEKTAEEIEALDQPRDDDDGIPLGSNTENRHVQGQIYIDPTGGPLNDEDYRILHAANHWEPAPVSHPIISGEQGRFQPQSSQAAIERFERLLRDTDSILSRSATWGTRRRSFPSVVDAEGVISGNFLKKLSISKAEPKKTGKPTGFLAELRGLVRRTSSSSIRKRSRSRSKSAQGDDLYRKDSQQSDERRDSSPHLSPTSRTSSWGKQPTPSINSVFATMATPLASIGSTHARSGSISGVTPVASPKSGFSLAVDKVLRRPRSKSELPKSSPLTVATEDPQASLVDLWKRSGGPPVVATRNKPVTVPAAPEADDEDDDDDDDSLEDSSMKKNPNEIDAIPHTYAGFQEHALKLNPGLENGGLYLVDRIAHQQVIRYKHLLNLKVNHMRQGANCSYGSLCMALGGSAKILGDQKGEKDRVGPLAARFEDDDSPAEGIISNESFPPDIPMPPTQYLPAEFECQLCYQKKKFQKPSDWTKHVHEDVGPFTCTWDKCKDPKTFKRKADWVRHENEGHRHLEWWTCDVDDCRHTCYRKDNFLQHLVREHKFIEPKVKTKAAMKRAGGVEPTWQKVEECHMETHKRPQDEPCKFCGRAFPTWKKLTVHLAKHMEQISLPVLRLVDMKAKELGADSIISPVQDPPVRQMLPVPSDQPGMGGMAFGNNALHPNHAQMGYGQSIGGFGYTMGQDNSQFYQTQYGSMGQTMQTSMADMSNGLNGMSNTMDMNGVSGFGTMNDVTGMNSYNTDRSMHTMGASAGQFGQADQSSYMGLSNNLSNNLDSNLNGNGLEPFPSLDGLGVQGMPGDGMGGQMMYENGMMGQQRASLNGSPFSGHETLSTYSHSPHMRATTQEQTTWDTRGMFP
ncbi:C2H2 finger domain-containing protein [Cordyceps javanica]|uniref:C2H2 finger domain-containing protein n=1 Tax=Cordyceps javanica TaxID=43265 RepID=A0A545VJT7_9HYPO|nr:C2H2 finger domain-containing protein [Cordyceps javanica]TQW02001.1 C2H2 finger domain-containing protein [Cordyceps javanica]